MAIANQKDTVRTYVLFNPQLELTKKKKPQPQKNIPRNMFVESQRASEKKSLMPTLKCTWFKQTDFLPWQPILQVVAILNRWTPGKYEETRHLYGPSWKHCSILSFWEVASY